MCSATFLLEIIMQPDSEVVTSNTTVKAMRVPESKRMNTLPRYLPDGVQCPCLANPRDAFGELFYQLRDFATQHAEAASILAAID
jgi:hypothetical protein